MWDSNCCRDTDPRQEEELCNGAYEALMLLEQQYDSEMFDRVKKHIQIICLSPTNGNASSYRTFRLYFICGLRFRASYSTKTLPITIAGFLVGHATLAKLKGCMAQEDKVNGAAKLEVCRKRQFLTKQKLQKVVCDVEGGSLNSTRPFPGEDFQL
jgi:hypothetical protein